MGPIWQVAGGLAMAAVQVGLFLAWLHRSRMRDKVNHSFIRDMATNHLPHIYHGLRQLARKQGVELEDPPMVQWIEVNGESKGH